jgi:hypothetical protein
LRFFDGKIVLRIAAGTAMNTIPHTVNPCFANGVICAVVAAVVGKIVSVRCVFDGYIFCKQSIYTACGINTIACVSLRKPDMTVGDSNVIGSS